MGEKQPDDPLMADFDQKLAKQRKETDKTTNVVSETTPKEGVNLSKTPKGTSQKKT